MRGDRKIQGDLERLKVLLPPRQRRHMCLVLLGLLAAALLEMVGLGSIPVFVGLLTDRDRIGALLPGGLAAALAGVEANSLIVGGAALLAALFFFKNLYLAGLIYVTERVVRHAAASVSTRLYRAYLYSPFTFHLQRNPAALIRNVTQEVTEGFQLLSYAMLLLRESMVLGVVFGLLLWMDPLVSVSVFTLLGLAAAAFYVRVRSLLGRSGQAIQVHRGGQLQSANQGLGAIKDAKILGREPFLLAEFQAETVGLQRQELINKVVSQYPRLVLEVLAIGAVLVVSVTFVLLGRPIADMMPVLSLLAVAVVRLVPAFNGITSSLGTIRYRRPSLELICDELCALEREAVQQPEDVAARPLRKALRLVSVSFAYAGAPRPAVHGVSLEIRAGESVAFIGASGAGKSTLVDLLLGLLEPSTGSVWVDDWQLDEQRTAWQRQIGYIPQDVYLIDDTIRRNVAFGLPDGEINESAVEQSLRAAQLLEFVAQLPEGLDTAVGNRGVRLSGGQRQRLGIARALYHNPRVLVMDEATSALDSATEREVVNAIQELRGERTIIMIAHRLSTVCDCDRLYLLRNGVIQDVGAYEEMRVKHPEMQLVGHDLNSTPSAAPV